MRSACQQVEYHGCGSEVEVLFGLVPAEPGAADPAINLNAGANAPLTTL